MPRLEDDNMNAKVTRLLKDLPKINTPLNFENELSKRITQSEQGKEKESWFDKVFLPKLIPSAALAVTAVIILFLLKGNVNEVDDPFQLIPRLREEQNVKQEQATGVSDKNLIVESKKINKREKSSDRVSTETESKKDFYRGDSNIIEESKVENASMERISVTTSNYLPAQAIIIGGGLNYKIVRSNEEERKEIEMLREKINQTTKYRRNN